MKTNRTSKNNNPLFVSEYGRVCIQCLLTKPWSEFHKQASASNGHKPRCKPCHNKTMNKSSKDIMAQEYKTHPKIIDFVIYRKHLKNKTQRKIS